uniref:D-lactate dehydrogenase n=1 Tax=Ningiella ruwaisensis TaxID=2364274 RepID=UPI0010A0181B|nr:D-lactate dehydrogenase [Ningiella ruwaisensis]
MNHSEHHAHILNDFVAALGQPFVEVKQNKTAHYRKGWRSGEGEALCVLFPQSLLQFWSALQICVNHKTIIIVQAANTGLTEGSTPKGKMGKSDSDYDRPVVVINTLAMSSLFVLGDDDKKGEQVLCLPGATLHTLEKTLKPLKRSPHSVIGSSCLGASIVGGVANNSGGALVKRGPAYTELALFAKVNEQGELVLVNHLGIDLGDTPEEMLTNLESGNFAKSLNSGDDKSSGKKASASDYPAHVRDINADTPSRYNADPSKLYEASGCAGKIAVFALRLDTFATPQKEQTFYIGTNDAQVLTRLRRSILSDFEHLPEVGEYMHKDMYRISEKYGKDTFLSIKHFGTDAMPKLFAIKGRVDAYLRKINKRLPLIPHELSDIFMQFIARLLPHHLPSRMQGFYYKYEHHLILKMSDGGIEEAKAFLPGFFAQTENEGDFFECNEQESQAAFLHRFAAAGAAVRYQTLHQDKVGEILALDIALKRNELNWVESLPEEISSQIELSLYYGHFFCHVFHQDYVLKKGADAKAVKQAMLALLDERGAKYPAEHNVGHLYEAEKALQSFYQSLDPTNTFNPGIGKMSKHRRNCACC